MISMIEFEQAISKFQNEFREQFIQKEKQRREQIRQEYLAVYNKFQESWVDYKEKFKDIPDKLKKFRDPQRNVWWRGGNLFEFDTMFPISEPIPEEISDHISKRKVEIFWKAFDETSFGCLAKYDKDIMAAAEKGYGINPGAIDYSKLAEEFLTKIGQ